MKIGKKDKASGILKVLLGLAAAGALLFASCQNIFDLPEPKKQAETGFGYVSVSLGEDAARTTRPDIGSGTGVGAFSEIEYIFKGRDPVTGDELEIVKTWSAKTAQNAGTTPQVFMLPAGKYKLEVVAYSATPVSTGSSSMKVAATGVYSLNDGFFTISSSGGQIDIKVLLTPKEGEGDGTLRVVITIPSQSDYVFRLQQYVGKSGTINDVTSDEFKIHTGKGTNGIYGDKKDVALWYTSGTPPTTVSTGYKLAPGSYLLTGKINLVSGGNVYVGGFSEAVHIVSNLQTEFKRDYADPTKDGPLAQVNDPAEAVKFLQEQLTSWIKPVPADPAKPANILSTLDTGSGPGVDLTTPGTITLNYIGTEMLKLNDPAVFPITLQGGWVVATDEWKPAANQSWTVGPYMGVREFKLVNNSVGAETKDGVTTYNARYTVALRAVAEYRVSYGRDVSTSGSGITIAGVNLIGDITGVRKGVAPITALPSTNIDIQVNNAAIRINNETASGPDGSVYKHNAVSDVYVVQIFETAAKQFETALKRLKDEIGGRNGATPWIGDPSILAKVDFQDDTKTFGNDTKTSTVLYYVAERLKTTVASPNGYYVEVNVPQDDLRWRQPAATYLGPRDGTTSDPKFRTTSPIDNMEFIFTPWGGAEEKYRVVFRPVAEFIVDFGPLTTKDTELDDNDPLILGTGKVSIKDQESPTANTTTLSKTDLTRKNPPRFLLSSSTAATTATNIEITLTDVAIQINDLISGSGYKVTTQGTPGYYDSVTNVKWDMQNAMKDNMNSTGSTATNSNVVGFDTFPGTYRLKGVASRVYKINVYPHLKQQILAAQDKLLGETVSKDWLRSVSTSDYTVQKPQRFETISSKNQATSSALANATIVYVGRYNEEPTVVWPVRGANTGKDAYIPENGWWPVVTATTSNYPLAGIVQPNPGIAGITSENGKKTVKINFKPNGGFTEPVFDLNLTRAVEFEIEFVKEPVGNDIAKGTVTVAGQSPWGGPYNGGTGKPFPGNTPVGTAPAEIIGLQTNPTFTAAGTIVRDVTDGHTSPKGTTGQNMSMPISGGDRRLKVYVYPTETDQIANVRSKLAGLSSINTWSTGSDYQISTVKATVATTASEFKTTFQVIASGSNYALNEPAPTSPNIITGINKLVVPAGFQFNKDLYGDVLLQSTTANDITNAIATGTKTVKFNFQAMGSTSAAQPVYTFEMQKVARYTVVFKEAPDKSKVYQSSLVFTSLEPGKGEKDAGTTITNADGSSRVYIGGTGTGTSGKSEEARLTISSSATGPNSTTTTVFAHNILDNGARGTLLSSPSVIFGAAGWASTAKTRLLSSNDYTIEVYPTIDNQIARVRTMMRAVSGPLQDTSTTVTNGWFNKIGVSGSGSSAVPDYTFVPGSGLKQSGDASDNTSEIQFWSTSGNANISKVPKVQIASGFFQAGYTIRLASGGDLQPEVQTAKVDGTWLKDTIMFTPIGGTGITGQNEVAAYFIRAIPVAKIDVIFTPGAVAKLTITTPKRTVPGSSTTVATSKPAGPIIAQQTLTEYLGIGNTEFLLEAAPGGVKDVSFDQPLGKDFSYSTGGGSGRLSLETNKNKGTYLISAQEYKIRVSNTD